MNKSFILSFVVMVCFVSCAREEPPATEPRPGFLSRVNPFSGSDGEKVDPAIRDLQAGVQTEPETMRLAEVRRLGVKFEVTNKGRDRPRLTFPSSQRYDAVLRDENGNLVRQWSEDQMFTQQVGHLMLNPGERVVYDFFLPTRGMNAGQEYELEVFLVEYPEVKARTTITTEE